MLQVESYKMPCLVLAAVGGGWKCHCLTVQLSCTVSLSFEQVHPPLLPHLLVTNAVVAQEAAAPVAALHWTD